jgi:hypothetical protein
MALKRRAGKDRKFQITAEAKAIWSSTRGEKICLTAGTAGLICHEKLAAALGLPAFVTLPDVASLATELSEKPQSLDGENDYARPARIRKRSDC